MPKSICTKFTAAAGSFSWVQMDALDLFEVGMWRAEAAVQSECRARLVDVPAPMLRCSARVLNMYYILATARKSSAKSAHRRT